jgi:hypothetical protein
LRKYIRLEAKVVAFLLLGGKLEKRGPLWAVELEDEDGWDIRIAL